MENYIEIIEKLNENLFEQHGEANYQFEYWTNGYCEIIKFGSEVILSSEMDDRTYNEETDAYEPMLPYIKRVYNQYLDKIFKLKLDHIEDSLGMISGEHKTL